MFAHASPTVVPGPTGDEVSGGRLWASDFTPSLSSSPAFATEAMGATQVPEARAEVTK